MSFPEVGEFPFPAETPYAYPPTPLDRKKDAGRVASDALSSCARPSVGLYLHIPFCLHFCQFCGFVKTRYDRDLSERYVEAIVRELESVGRSVAGATVIDAIYFGGGSASTLSLKQVERILEAICRVLHIAEDAELSFEGEALSLHRTGYLNGLKSLGFNRLSFGVQLASATLRKILNLRPSMSTLRQVAERAAPLFGDVAIDYMYAWPGMALQDTIDDLGVVLNEVPSTTVELFRVELLDAAPFLAVPLYSLATKAEMDEQYLRTYQAAAHLLVERGFSRRSYTLFGRELTYRPLRYYSHYYGWDGGSVIGVGVGAQSFFGGIMFGNGADVDEYLVMANSGAIPSTTHVKYDESDKERATWPRRGWIRNDAIADAREVYRLTIRRAAEAGLVSKLGDRTLLTDKGWAFVPALMHALTPRATRQKFDRFSQLRLQQQLNFVKQYAG